MSSSHLTDEAFLSAHLTSNSLLSPTIKAWRFYLDDQAMSPHTTKAFTGDLLLLSAYLPPDRTLRDISTLELTRFLEWLEKGRGVPCSPKTLARRITSIKSFFRWLHSKGVLLIDPAEPIPQRTVLSPLPEVLTQEETHLVLEAADAHRRLSRPDARTYTLVALLLATGIKKGECLALSPNHVDLETETGPLLFIRYANPQHRYKERKIELPANWIEAMQEYKSQYEVTDRLFPWSPRRLEYLLEDLSNETGLTKHLSFDMCRWTCARNDWLGGIDKEKIRQKLGLSKIQWREISMKLEQLSGNP